MAVDPVTRGPLPESALFLAPAYPRSARPALIGRDATASRWFGSHLHLRGAVKRLDETLATLNPFSVDTNALARDILGQSQSFLGSLSAHHRVEDEHYFPAFAAAEPRLAAGIAVLDADHHFVHDAIDSLWGTTQRVVGEFAGAVPTPGAVRGHLRDDYREELRRFGASLTRHLDDEEDLMVPFMLHRAGVVPEVL